MGAADLVLVLANLIYATSYVATRLTLEDVPPAALALVRLVVGALLLAGLAAGRRRPADLPPARGDRWRVAGMGVGGFAAAFALFHWGVVRSTATNAALLIVVEPVAVILLSPALLGERLTRREAAGAGLALAGALVVVVNGIPGLSERLVPHWQGDVLLALSGVAYASYSLLGRDVLRRHDALRVTAQSIVWGAAAMVPLTALEVASGLRPAWTPRALLGVAYLAVVITALGYLVWNWALARVPAPRAAIFLNIQPIAGALLGVLLLGEAATAYTVGGGLLIVAGLALTVRRRR